MTPGAYRSLMDRWGLDHARMAEYFGYTPRASGRYADGKRSVQEPLARQFRFLVRARITPKRFYALSRPVSTARPATADVDAVASSR